MSQSEKDKYKVLNRQQDYEDEMTNFEKEFSAMKIPDVSTFKTADEMVWKLL